MHSQCIIFYDSDLRRGGNELTELASIDAMCFRPPFVTIADSYEVRSGGTDYSVYLLVILDHRA